MECDPWGRPGGNDKHRLPSCSGCSLMGCLTHCINSKDPVSAAMTKGLKRKREALPPWLNGRIVGRSCEVEAGSPLSLSVSAMGWIRLRNVMMHRNGSAMVLSITSFALKTPDEKKMRQVVKSEKKGKLKRNVERGTALANTCSWPS